MAAIPSPLRFRLLLVDQDDAPRRLLATICAGIGCVLRTAPDCATAAALARRWRPDLLLIDLPAYASAGYELLETLDETTHVIVISAHDAIADVRAAFSAGVVDYVRKPFDAAELAARLRVALAPPSAPRELLPREPFSGGIEGGRPQLYRDPPRAKGHGSQRGDPALT